MAFFDFLSKAISAVRPRKTTAKTPPAHVNPIRGLSHDYDSADDTLYSGDWLYVGSTNVERWRYSYDDQDLYVDFLNGSAYVYHGIPVDLVKKFYHTDSPGRFVWNWLRDRFPYDRLVQAPRRPRRPPRVIRIIRHGTPQP